MITSDEQHRATRAHLAKFEEAIANLEGQASGASDKKRRALELKTFV
jgi:hypothetical protein